MIRCKKCTFHKQSGYEMSYANFQDGKGNQKSPLMLVFDSVFLSDVQKDVLASDERYNSMIDQWLQQVGLSLNQIYTTTFLKCYISNKKKKPTKPMKERCAELYLKEEIARVKPKVILLCGSMVSKFFIPEMQNMKQIVGKSFYSNVYKCYFVPLFDPYYLSNFSSQSPQIKRTLKAFGLAKSLLVKPYKDPHIPHKTDLKTLQQLDDIVSVDLETTGLDFRGERILTIGISDLKNRACFDTTNINWDVIIPELKKRKLVFQNGIFDLLFLMQLGYDLTGSLFADTRLMQFILNPLGGNALGFLIQLYYGVGYKDKVDRGNLITLSPQERCQYCGEDVYYTLKLFYELYPKLKKRGSLMAFKIKVNILKILVKMYYRGIGIDKEKCEELITHYQEIREKIKEKFKKQFKLAEDFNLNSPKQLVELLFNKLQLPPTILTTGNNPSTGVKAIKMLVKQRPSLQGLLDYRESKGHIEKCKLYLKHTSDDNRLRSKFNQFSPSSARLMSAKPNIQNVPRNSRHKEIFIARPGYTFVYFDYAQIEFRVWMHLSNDLQGIDFINKGRDIHRYIGSKFHRKPESEITPKERDEIKAVVYGSMYGRTPYGITLQYGVPEEAAKEIQKIFFAICRTGYFWMKQVEQEVVRNKYLKTPFGSYRFFPELEMASEKKRKEILREAKSYIVQSWAVELVFIGMHKLYQELARQKLDAHFVHQIHDACILEVRDDQVEIAKKIIYNKAQNPYPLKVPLTVDLKVGKSWADVLKK